MPSNQTIFSKDSLILGILMGAFVPVVAYALLLTLKDALLSGGILPELWDTLPSTIRTIAVLAICANLILIQFFNSRRFTNAMRGLVFPTFAYIILWFVVYGAEIFAKF